MKKIKFTKVRDVKTPTRGTASSAGLDFYIPNDVHKYVREFPPHGETGCMMHPGMAVKIPSGIHVELPKGHALIAFNKSGVALKKGLQVGACVIDEDYQGEIHLHVVNVGDHIPTIEAGEKLVQFLLVPIEYAQLNELPSVEALYKHETQRGAGGFGSTGDK